MEFNSFDISSAPVEILSDTDDFLEETSLLDVLVQLRGECFFNIFIGKLIFNLLLWILYIIYTYKY